MKAEYDFSQGERGKFFRSNARFHLPTDDQSAHLAGPLPRKTQQPETTAFSLNPFTESGFSVAHA